jgi:protein-L-isoaspartate(D-aspartate) O-methyltransferase
MVRDQARRGDVTDPRVVEAMGRVPREAFVPERLRDDAYEERALPIGLGQTISQPLMVATMTEALTLSPGERVLEVGSGSGYQVAVLRHLVDDVVGVERIPELVERARSTLLEIGIDDIELHVGDGTLGWPDRAPYDAVVVTAGGPSVPAALLDQLAPGGRLVMPVGPRGGERLVRVRRRADGTFAEPEDLGPVSFVPLIGAQGWDAGDD